MGWRKTMGAKTVKITSTPIRNIRNMSNIQEKNSIKGNIADIADIAPKIKNEKSIQQQHDHLWQKAWNLADWIDDSLSALPWQERAAKVPELQAMSRELDQLEKAGANPPINPKLDIPGQCPARCKQTGKCYAYAIFDGKPGQPIPCNPDTCQINKEN